MSRLDELNRKLAQLKARRAYENARARRESGETAPEYDPTEGMGEFEKFHTGMWSGFSRGAKGLVNLALPDALTPEFASDEALAKQDESDAALRNTRAGFWGGLVGEVGSTLPVGGGAGTLAKVGANSGRLLRAATSTPARGALEGAITSAATASPDDRGEAARFGGVFGGTLGAASNVVGRFGHGLAPRSREAENLDFMASQHGEKTFIPLAQAVGDEGDVVQRLTKSLYRDALPYAPGVSGQISGQSRRLGESFRRTALKEADSLDPANKTLTPALLNNPEAAIPELRKSVTRAFDEAVGNHKYSLPIESTRKAMIRGQLRRAFSHIDDTTVNKTVNKALFIMRRFSSGKDEILGKNLLNAKNQISDMIGGASGIEKAALVEINNMLEMQIKRQTPAARFDLYERAKEAHANVSALERSFSAADEFTPTTLRRKSGAKSGERQVARTFGKVLRNSVGTPGAAGRRLGQIGAGVLGVWNLPLAVGGIAGANLLARPGVQNALMGNTKVQKLLVKALNKNPEARRAIGSAARAALTTQVD